MEEKKTNIGDGKKILVVDDDPTSLELAGGILDNVGFETIKAITGQDAWLKMTPENMPHLIIADVIMPEMDGLRFFKQLKKNKETEPIPVLVLTSRKKMEDTFLALGADAFMSKPIDDTQHFLDVVSQLASRKGPVDVPKDGTPKEAPKDDSSK